MALTDRETRLTLCRDPNFGDGERHIVAQPLAPANSLPAAADAGDLEQVPATTLDAYWTAQGKPRIDFIKMDVEDHELSVLRGARQLLEHNRQIALLLECTPEGCQRAGHKQDDVFDLLRGLGFGLFAWSKRRRVWDTDDMLLRQVGNIWATRDAAATPKRAAA
jgi:hypothetical protein